MDAHQVVRMDPFFGPPFFFPSTSPREVAALAPTPTRKALTRLHEIQDHHKVFFEPTCR